MTRWIVPALILACPLIWAQIPAGPAPVSRTVLALFDSRYETTADTSPIHRLIEMPLNHLGLTVRYWDINAGLPGERDMEGVLGVLSHFSDSRMADPGGFLRWAGQQIDQGRKYVLLGELSVDTDLNARPTSSRAVDAFLAKLGLRSGREWRRLTYEAEIVHKVAPMVEFERTLTGVLPPFVVMRKIDGVGTSYLTVRRKGDPESSADLVVISPAGGYVAARYLLHEDVDAGQRQWRVQPFEFFRLAFSTDALPKPDTTTHTGRRIYYSHIDGDGWRNVTEVPQYRKMRTLSAEVVLRDALRPFPDLPVSVAPIAGDLDPEWHGSAETQRIARESFDLPHVEMGSHTYSHPLDWGYFASPPEQRMPASASRGPLTGPAFLWWRSIQKAVLPKKSPVTESAANWKSGYDSPRAYDVKPFDLTAEITGSIDYINRFGPGTKRVQILQWSGDTTPYAEALELARRGGVRNINGGDTRFDRERLSYGWVSPLSRQVGPYRQVFASNSNENTYTDLWTDRFFGFKFLISTLENTETPFRIKPVNVYYHMYSGEKLSALNALLEVLRWVRNQEFAPLSASRYASIVDGFHSVRFIPLGAERWRVEDRDGLQTLRFDRATGKGVDFSRSSGVLGQRHVRGNLYVALDPAVAAPVVALQKHSPLNETGPVHLVESRWDIRGLRKGDDEFTFTASGYGAGDMTWQVGGGGSYAVVASTPAGQAVWSGSTVPDSEGRLGFAIDADGVDGLVVRAKRRSSAVR